MSCLTWFCIVFPTARFLERERVRCTSITLSSIKQKGNQTSPTRPDPHRSCGVLLRIPKSKQLVDKFPDTSLLYRCICSSLCRMWCTRDTTTLTTLNGARFTIFEADAGHGCGIQKCELLGIAVTPFTLTCVQATCGATPRAPTRTVGAVAPLRQIDTFLLKIARRADTLHLCSRDPRSSNPIEGDVV